MAAQLQIGLYLISIRAASVLFCDESAASLVVQARYGRSVAGADAVGVATAQRIVGIDLALCVYVKRLRSNCR
jgi:hypothetical protein